MNICFVFSLTRLNPPPPPPLLPLPLKLSVTISVEVTEEIMFSGMYVDAHATTYPIRRSPRADCSQNVRRLL
jgi:hypothetical protein